MAKVSFILLLFLLALSSGGKKKGKGKPSGGFNQNWLQGLRTPPPTAKPTTVSPLVTLKRGFSWTAINSTDKFYEVFNLNPLPAEKKGKGHGSSAACDSHYNSACGVRPTWVPFPRPRFGEFYFPSGTVVDRCSGFCFSPHDVQTCKPVQSITRSINAYHFSLGSSGKSMSVASGIQMSTSLKVIDVEEHEHCLCQCVKTPASCDPVTQVWNSGSCGCECKPEHQQHRLNCQGDFTYNPNKCKCVCAKGSQHCASTQKKWSHSDCACVCKNKDIRCPVGQFRNQVTCACEKLRVKKN